MSFQKTVFLIFLLFSTACAKQKGSANYSGDSAPAETAATEAIPDRSPPRIRIEELWSEIDSARQELAIDMATLPQLIELDDFERECPTPAGATCQESCTLADSICDNAASICNIASGDLAADPWAQQKCEDAKRVCGAAEKQCCQCVASP